MIGAAVVTGAAVVAGAGVPGVATGVVAGAALSGGAARGQARADVDVSPMTVTTATRPGPSRCLRTRMEFGTC